MRCQVNGSRGQCRRPATWVVEGTNRKDFGVLTIATCYQHMRYFVAGDSAIWTVEDWIASHPSEEARNAQTV